MNANIRWQQDLLRFVAGQCAADGGRYRYAAGSTVPMLYSSTYAAMARHMLGDRDALPQGERAEWIAYLQAHQDDDGLFRFIRNRPFEYGHRELRGEANQGAMFPTWFRLLSLALIGKALPEHTLGQVPWRLLRCPGMQFWGTRR